MGKLFLYKERTKMINLLIKVLCVLTLIAKISVGAVFTVKKYRLIAVSLAFTEDVFFNTFLFSTFVEITICITMCIQLNRVRRFMLMFFFPLMFLMRLWGLTYSVRDRRFSLIFISLSICIIVMSILCAIFGEQEPRDELSSAKSTTTKEFYSDSDIESKQPVRKHKRKKTSKRRKRKTTSASENQIDFSRES